MRRFAAWLVLSLCLLSTVYADSGEPPATDPQARIAELERENAMLRRQWGQATLELDQLRKQNDALARQLGELRRRLEAQSPTESAPASGPSIEASTSDDRLAELEAELARLRRENEDLQVQTTQLTELAGVTPEGERVASAEARFTTETGNGHTVVRSRPEKLHMLSGARADHYLTLEYRYPADGKPDPSMSLTGYLQTAFSGGVHRDADALAITVDGDETVHLPVTDYRSNLRQTGMAGKRRVDKSDETIVFSVSPEALRRLARATTATGRIGDVSFEITPAQLAVFRAMQKRLEMGL